MRTRTLYEVLDRVMQDYTYTLKKAGNKIEITGVVRIEQIDQEVSYSKEFYCENFSDDVMADRICRFKEEFKQRVVKVITDHKEVLIDDEALIKKLNEQVAELRKENEALSDTCKQLMERITKLEEEKNINVPVTPFNPVMPYPNIPTDPWQPYPNTTPCPPYHEWPKIWCSNDTQTTTNEAKPNK